MDDKPVKRYLFCGDSQSGHIGGLTHPDWRLSEKRNAKLIARGQGDWVKVQDVGWNFFVENTQAHYDGMFLMGDLIDGKGHFNGSRECLTTDRTEQQEMAVANFSHIDTDETVGVSGTCYHTGASEKWEPKILHDLGGTLRDIAEVHVNGLDLLIRARHHIGRTSTPVGGDIMLRKQMIDETSWQRDHDFRPADLYAFAHAHYCRIMQDVSWTAFIVPALQMWTEFGSTRCSGLIHYGVLELLIYADKSYRFIPKTMKLNKVALNEPLEW